MARSGPDSGPEVRRDETFESAFRYASIGMALVAPDGAFLRVNPAFCQITGRAESELIGTLAQDITHPEDLAVGLDLLHRLARDELPSYEVEKRYIRPDGEPAWVLLSVSAVRDPDGSVRHYIAQAQDIGARRRAEAELNAGERRYRTIAETTSDIIVMTGLSGLVDYVSPAVRHYGWRPGDLVGTRFVERLHPDDVAGVTDGVKGLLRTGSVKRLRWRARHGVSGEWRWFESNASLIHDEAGAPVTILDVVRDVHDEVTAAAEIAEARARAEQAAQIKAQFLANMSHEIRTPLTAVLGFTGLLRSRDDLPADAADQVEKVERAGRGLLALVNDVLDFSRLEAGGFEIRPQTAVLADVCRDVIATFGQVADDKGIELNLSVDPCFEAPRGFDPDRLRQMLLNLLGNALKFTDRGQVSLRVALADDPAWTEIAVSDTGPGIPLQAQSQLFQRFSQVDGSRSREHGGAGLGLAITRGIAEAMGGDVAVRSSPGEGATFILRLPTPKPAEAPTPHESASPDIAGLRVLIVDDNAANRTLAEQMLGALRASAESTDSGEAALERLATTPFDVVLMDLRMPGLDGAETLARLRASGGPNRETPTLAFTADADAEPGLLDTFDGVVRKPIDLREMLTALAEAATPAG